MAANLPKFSGITSPGSHLTDHESIVDTIHRLTESVDSEDAAMFESAIFDDTEWDVSGLTFLGKNYGVLKGKEEMIHWQMTGPAPVLTTHMVSNARSHVTFLEDGSKTATCTAFVLAQHLPRDTPNDKISTWDKDVFLAGNRLSGEMKWDGDRWRFTRFAISCIWSVGDNEFIVAGRPKARPDVTCRDRKVKCDETKPKCNQCRRSRRTCAYSDSNVFRIETPSNNRTSRQSASEHQGASVTRKRGNRSGASHKFIYSHFGEENSSRTEHQSPSSGSTNRTETHERAETILGPRNTPGFALVDEGSAHSTPQATAYEAEPSLVDETLRASLTPSRRRIQNETSGEEQVAVLYESPLTVDHLHYIDHSQVSEASPHTNAPVEVAVGTVNQVRGTLVTDTSIQVHLLRHFQSTIGQWMDVFDTSVYFSQKVPLRASRSELLKSAIYAISAKHLYRIGGPRSAPTSDERNPRPHLKKPDWKYLSVHYYDKAINLLKSSIDSLSSALEYHVSSASKDEACAVVTILCQYELMDAPGRTWSAHLSAIPLCMPGASPENVEGAGVAPQMTIQPSIFWSLARQDILCACISETQTRMKIEDLQLWQIAGLSSDNNQVPLAMCLDSLAPKSPADDVVAEDTIAKDLVCILSKVINFVTAGDAVYAQDYALPDGQRVTLAVAQDVLSQHWRTISSDLEKWHTNLPQSFPSASHTDDDMADVSSPDPANQPHHGFPKIYYETPICAATMLSYHMASILLYANRPMESTAIRSSVSARLRHYQQDMQRTNRHAREVCGIVSQERSEAVLVHAIQPLFVAGQVFSSSQDQAAVSALLRNIEDKTGWSTSWFIDTMRQNWNT